MSNWYDLPRYYDVSFSHEMRDELRFLKAICHSYDYHGHLRVLEPACGTGRLLVPLAAQGYDCTGIDINPYSLDYLKQKLQRRRLQARLVQADISSFSVNRKHTVAYCTVDSFRHLLTEKQALAHMDCMSQALEPNGIYVLGMHLLAERQVNARIIRWTHSRGRLTLRTSMSLLGINRQKRRETLKVVMQPVNRKSKEKHVSVYDLRTYTLKQFQRLLRKSSRFRIIGAYDEYYDLDRQLQLGESTEYAVFILQRI